MIYLHYILVLSGKYPTDQTLDRMQSDARVRDEQGNNGIIIEESRAARYHLWTV